jgi:hypothetical protein
MKKQISFPLVLTFVALLYCLSPRAQQSGGTMMTIAPDRNAGSEKVNTAGHMNVYENRAEAALPAARPAKRFSKIYPRAHNPQWTRLDDCYRVCFSDNGLKTTVVFRENGKMNYAITELATEDIPAGLQQLIKQDYDNFRILKAVEINDNGRILHHVVLENVSSYVTIKSSGEEIEVTRNNNASADKYNL